MFCLFLTLLIHTLFFSSFNRCSHRNNENKHTPEVNFPLVITNEPCTFVEITIIKKMYDVFFFVCDTNKEFSVQYFAYTRHFSINLL